MLLIWILYGAWIGYRNWYRIKPWLNSNWLPFVGFTALGMFFIGFSIFLAGFCGYVLTITFRRWQYARTVGFEVKPALIGSGVYAVYMFLIYGFNVQILTVPSVFIRIVAVGVLIGLWFANGNPSIRGFIKERRYRR